MPGREKYIGNNWSQAKKQALLVTGSRVEWGLITLAPIVISPSPVLNFELRDLVFVLQTRDFQILTMHPSFLY